ncbi:MAG: hypothetical protein M3143_12860 [Actinomycetota bacterium]|nr:hypothetical protein [Actinomycetota bacterium]
MTVARIPPGPPTRDRRRVAGHHQAQVRQHRDPRGVAPVITVNRFEQSAVLGEIFAADPATSPSPR